MKRHLVLASALAVLVAGGSAFSLAGEGCGKHGSGDHKHKKEAMGGIEMDQKLTKDARVEAYKAKYPDISHDDLIKSLDAKNVVVVDANGLDTYKKNRVPGALSIHDTKKIREALPKDKDALVVTYCGSPKCTAWFLAADYVAGLGYTNVKHYSLGIKGWLEKSKS